MVRPCKTILRHVRDIQTGSWKMLAREGWTPPLRMLQASWVHGARVARSCFPHSCNWVPLLLLCALVEGWNDWRCSWWIAFGHWTTLDLWCIILGFWWVLFLFSHDWWPRWYGGNLALHNEFDVGTIITFSYLWNKCQLAWFCWVPHDATRYSSPLNRSWLASRNHHSNHIRTSHHTPLVFFSCTTLKTNRADTKRVAHW